MATTKVDESGRVLIPRAILDGLGLDAGTEVDVSEQEGCIVLTPASEDAFMEIEDGVLVFTGKATGDVTDIIRRVREQRNHQVLGMDES